MESKKQKSVKHDEFFAEEKIQKFIDEAYRLRAEQGEHASPQEIAKASASALGIGSCARQLALAAMRTEIWAKSREIPNVGFWVEASTALCCRSDAFDVGWLDDFNKMFVARVADEFDPGIAEKCCIPDRTARKFLNMLSSAVAFAENKGKVEKVKLEKSVGYRFIKQWSEDLRSCLSVRGFSEKDRESMSAIDKKVSDLQQTLSQSLERLMRDAAKVQSEKIEDLGGRLESAEAAVQKEKDRSAGLSRELSVASSRMKAIETRALGMEEDCKRKIALLEDAAETARVRIEDAVRPILQQYVEAQDMEMTVELGKAMKLQLGRVFDALRTNGILK